MFGVMFYRRRLSIEWFPCSVGLLAVILVLTLTLTKRTKTHELTQACRHRPQEGRWLKLRCHLGSSVHIGAPLIRSFGCHKESTVV
jgi:hypothetical protein